MKDYWNMLLRNSLARDYAIAGGVLVVLSLFAVHAVKALIDQTRANVKVETASISPPSEKTRNYQISRSVLDDSVVTGSISRSQAGNRPVILDPCTGQVKN